MVNDSIAPRSAAGALLIFAALFIGGCSSNSTSPTNGSTTDNIVGVRITDGVFSPNPLTVRVGQVVNWHNQDAIAHTATDPGVFDIGSISPGSAASSNGDGVTFNTVGTFNYHCTIHPNETATVIVTQ